jgi:nonribosomal peptide synthetase DhbF
VNVAYRRQAWSKGHSPEPTLADHIERWARATPDRVALIFQDEHVTWAELDERANRLAWRLIADGVGPDDLVAVCLDRSVDLIVALVAVLKSGAAYLPLNPTSPKDRLAFIATDAGAACALTTNRLVRLLPDDVPALRLDDEMFEASLFDERTDAPMDRDRVGRLTTANLAYVLYTSGSTGRPKGVGVTHANVLALFDATAREFTFRSDHVWLQFHSYGFDVSVWEIFGALLHGGSLVIPDERTRQSPDLLLDLIESEQVSVLCQTPSAFNVFIEEYRRRPRALPDLEFITFIGEALELRRLRPWLAWRGEAGPTLINKYGPTETTVFNTWKVIEASEIDAGGPNSIGAALDNGPVHILDGRLEPVAAGEVGEVYLSGPQLARGYLNRPGLTSERFIANPFGPPGSRMYRTGDLGRWLDGGDIEFLGRADEQVKLRGYRIELGEIEAVLTELPQIAQAAVAVREVRGEPTLGAFLVARPGQSLPQAGEIRNTLARRLPEYMIPTVFAPILALPLNSSGKLDRKALPEIGHVASPATRAGRAPANAREERMCAIFGKVLGLAPPGADESFFDLGGHSLRGLRLLNDVEAAFGRRLPLRALLERPTPEGLVAALDDPSLGKADLKSVVPLASGGVGAPIFMIHWMERDLAKALGERRTVIGLSHGLAVRGQQTLDLPPDVEGLAAHYIEEMRQVQPQGPYRLIGHSSGGLVAYEMAQQLSRNGETVGFLGLLDTQTPEGNANRGKLPLLAQLRNVWRAPAPALRRYLLRSTYRIMAAFGPTRRLLLVAETKDGTGLDVISDRMMASYRPKPYPRPLQLYECTLTEPALRRAPPPKPSATWGRYLPAGFEVRELEGDHVQAVREPFARSTASIIEADLQAHEEANRPLDHRLGDLGDAAAA